jgi:hypothetical protein
VYDTPVSVLPAQISAGVAGAGLFALTGWNILWLVLALFALVAAGTAIMRIVPRRGEV